MSRTLLIPLRGRAEAAGWHPTFRDPLAEKLVARLGSSVPEISRLARLMSVVRADALDAIARSFLAARPEGVVYNLAAGFCTRFQRVDNGRCRVVDVDLPAVIDAKRELLDAEHALDPRHALHAGSLVELDWLGPAATAAGEPVLVLAEGVLHYLPPREVREFFTRLAERLPRGSRVAFDYYVPAVLRKRGAHPKAAPLQWAVASAEEVAALASRYRLDNDRSLVAEAARYHWGIKLATFLPKVRNFYNIADLSIVY